MITYIEHTCPETGVKSWSYSLDGTDFSLIEGGDEYRLMQERVAAGEARIEPSAQRRGR